MMSGDRVPGRWVQVSRRWRWLAAATMVGLAFATITGVGIAVAGSQPASAHSDGTFTTADSNPATIQGDYIDHVAACDGASGMLVGIPIDSLGRLIWEDVAILEPCPESAVAIDSTSDTPDTQSTTIQSTESPTTEPRRPTSDGTTESTPPTTTAGSNVQIEWVNCSAIRVTGNAADVVVDTGFYDEAGVGGQHLPLGPVNGSKVFHPEAYEGLNGFTIVYVAVYDQEYPGAEPIATKRNPNAERCDEQIQPDGTSGESSTTTSAPSTTTESTQTTSSESTQTTSESASTTTSESASFTTSPPTASASAQSTAEQTTNAGSTQANTTTETPTS